MQNVDDRTLQKIIRSLTIIFILLLGFYFYYSHTTNTALERPDPIAEQQKKIETKYPLIKALPYSTPYYSMYYDSNGDSVTITVKTPSPYYRFFALEKMRNLGYDPTDYVINYLDYTSPLGVKQ
jgi:hypothetical protein